VNARSPPPAVLARIAELKAQAWPDRKIARELKVHHNTVRRALGRESPSDVAKRRNPSAAQVATAQRLAGEAPSREPLASREPESEPVPTAEEVAGRRGALVVQESPDDPGWRLRQDAEVGIRKVLLRALEGKQWALVLAAAKSLNDLANGLIGARVAAQRVLVYVDQRRGGATGDAAAEEIDRLFRATLKRMRGLVVAGRITEEAYGQLLGALETEVQGRTIEATGERDGTTETRIETTG